MAEPNEPPGTAAFPSLAALREAHQRRLRDTARRRRDPAVGPASASELAAFIDAIEATGAVLSDDGERVSAQSMLDYWAAEQVNSTEVDPKTWTPPVLVEFRAGNPAQSREAAAESKVQADRRQDDARRQIRLAALARQWRDSGQLPGYLLKEDALAEAQPYRSRDPEIAALVAESEKAELAADRSKRRTLYGMVGVLAVLAGLFALLAAYAYQQRNDAIADREIAEEKSKIAQEQSARATNLWKELENANRILLEQQHLTETQLASANATLAQANARQEKLLAQLSLAMRDAIELVLDGRLRRSDVSPELLESLDAEIRAAVAAGRLAPEALPAEFRDALADGKTATSDRLPTEDPLFVGYDAAFTGVRVPAPQVAPTRWTKQRQLDYVNYSLSFEPELRQALFSASNVDRQQLRVVRRLATETFAPDPRLPPDRQLSDEFFRKDERIDRSHLVSRQEIAWGPYFPGDDAAAARKLAAMVNVFTNAAPQFDTVNRTTWSGLERWVLTAHNPAASRIGVFSGPVFGDDDEIRGGVRIPRAYWKIAVSPRLDSKGELVADAFLVPQYAPGTDEIAPAGDFAPDAYRVTVGGIEALTGLDFGRDVRFARDSGTTRTDADRTDGDRLAALVPALDAPTGTQRVDIAGQLIDALRDRPLAESEQRKIVAALTDLARDGSIESLTQTGRYNLLFVLSEIPRASWDRPAWLDLKAQARRAAADLRYRGDAGKAEIGPTAAVFLATLGGRVGLADAPGAIVWPHFAGMERSAVVAVMDRLRLLGWQVQPEERTGKAAKLNEVRYGDPADRAAAELLAADLRAAGQPDARTVKQIRIIAKGNPEVWISK